jgi:hypothetical protein
MLENVRDVSRTRVDAPRVSIRSPAHDTVQYDMRDMRVAIKSMVIISTVIKTVARMCWEVEAVSSVWLHIDNVYYALCNIRQDRECIS